MTFLVLHPRGAVGVWTVPKQQDQPNGPQSRVLASLRIREHWKAEVYIPLPVALIRDFQITN